MSNAPGAVDEHRAFKVIHIFHPLFGREFALINATNCWGENRVFYFDDTRQVRSLPARWTSVAADEPFVVVSAGRAHFRVEDLLELAKLIRGTRP